MSKLFVFALIVCVAVVACKSNKNKKVTEAQPGHCLHKGHSIKEGEMLPAAVGKCKATKCIDAAANTVKTITCSPQEMGNNCVKVSKGRNRNEAYPACCPKMKCSS